MRQWKFGQGRHVGRKRSRKVSSTRRDVTEYTWFEAPSNSSPEVQLAAAVLQRAIMDLMTNGVSNRDKTTAIEWLTGSFGSEFEVEYEFSFTRIVELISNLSADEMRERILKFIKDAETEKSLADNFRFQRGKKHTKNREDERQLLARS